MTKVYDKKDSLREMSGILNQARPSSILLIRGNDSYETSGAEGYIKPQLNGYNVTHLSGFRKSPFSQDVEKAVGIIKQENVDFIIGIGGGTVMDIAKAASLLHNEQGNLEDFITGKIKPRGDNIRRLLIPTTSGTGAEITPFSVVYVNKKKY